MKAPNIKNRFYTCVTHDNISISNNSLQTVEKLVQRVFLPRARIASIILEANLTTDQINQIASIALIASYCITCNDTTSCNKSKCTCTLKSA